MMCMRSAIQFTLSASSNYHMATSVVDVLFSESVTSFITWVSRKVLSKYTEYITIIKQSGDITSVIECDHNNVYDAITWRVWCNNLTSMKKDHSKIQITSHNFLLHIFYT